jgi:hypothetical protein
MGRAKLRRGHTITVLAVGVQGPPAAPQRLVRGGYVGTRLRVVGATLPLAAAQRSALPRLDVRDRCACRARLDARRAPRPARRKRLLPARAPGLRGRRRRHRRRQRSAAAAINMLFDGANVGKLVVRVADD